MSTIQEQANSAAKEVTAEPVGYLHNGIFKGKDFYGCFFENTDTVVALYAHPPKETEPLPDDIVQAMANEIGTYNSPVTVAIAKRCASIAQRYIDAARAESSPIKKPKRCENCGSTDIKMFNSDMDFCNTCKHQFYV